MSSRDDCTRDEEENLEDELTEVDNKLDAMERGADLSAVKNVLAYEYLLSQRKTLVRKIKEKRERQEVDKATRSYRCYV